MSNRIREIRLSRGLSQERLAETLGVTKGQVSRLELDQRGLTHEWMIRLAKALACAPAELLPLSDFPASEAQLLSQFRRMTKAEQDQLIRLAVALAPPPPPSKLPPSKAA